jgi:23S rRNA (guanosine2251-2'-O)-methyltransferase
MAARRNEMNRSDKAAKPLVIFGINPIMEKLRSSPEQVSELMVVRRHEGASLNSIIEAAQRCGLPVRYVDAQRLSLLTAGGAHQGVAATTMPYSYLPLAELLQALAHGPARQHILVVDGVTDPRNFGALLRSAEGAGVRYVVIPQDRSVGVTPAVVKSSAGAVYYLKIYRVSNLRRALQDLKHAGCWVVGLDAGAAEGIYDRVFPEKVAIILGSEGTGIRPLIRRECDFLVSIPMRGRVASLNVSVAGGIFLYELVRQGQRAEADLSKP